MSIPKPKILGARLFVLSDELIPGKPNLCLETLQTLRGLIQHWLAASNFRRSVNRVNDSLLEYPYETQALAQCPVMEIWTSFCYMVDFVRQLASEDSIWESLFPCSVQRLVDTAKRFSGRNREADSVWITGDAALQSIGCVNWKSCEYMRYPANAILSQFANTNQTHRIIAERELGTIAAEVAQWANDPGKILFIWADNNNSPRWSTRGKANRGVPSRVISKLPGCGILQDIGVATSILRSHHNLPPDFFTRASGNSINSWATANGFVEGDLNSTKWTEFINCVPRLRCVDNLAPSPSDMSLSPVPVRGEFQPEAGNFIKCGLAPHWDIQPCHVGNVSIFRVIFAQAQSFLEIKSIRS